MDISTAPQEWQRWWFSLPSERRSHIEAHLEICQELLNVLQRLDITDRGQFPVWKRLRQDSGWSQKKLGPVVGLHRTELSRYERGERIPTRSNGPLYRALLWNFGADADHSHLVRMAWAIYWSEQGQPAPEIVEATEAFLDWTDKQHKHPLLGNLPQGLPYDEHLPWPLQTAAA